jgi:lipopolysaccharide/colanic/teichoic acid biosynthesis glycosyltransferase
MLYRCCGKRMLDVAASALLLVPLAPLLLLVAVCVRLGSAGPILFRQQRGGRGGRLFTMLKFRTMAVDLHAERKGFEPGSGRRVTRLGGILRKTKIDELPQLVNVLRGDMSLVGPRPEVPTYLALYPERWTRVLAVRPGVTDPASIRYRNEEELLAAATDPEREYREVILPRKLDLYEEYARAITLWGDVKILAATIFVVLAK